MKKIFFNIVFLPWRVCRSIGRWIGHLSAVCFFLALLGLATHALLPPHLRTSIDEWFQDLQKEWQKLQQTSKHVTSQPAISRSLSPKPSIVRAVSPKSTPKSTPNHNDKPEIYSYTLPFLAQPLPSKQDKEVRPPLQTAATSPKPTTLQKNKKAKTAQTGRCFGRQTLFLHIRSAKLRPTQPDGKAWDCGEEKSNAHWGFAAVDLLNPTRCAPDPYVTFEHNNASPLRTSVLNNQYLPRWNDTFRLSEFSFGDRLKLAVYDANHPLRMDTHMGGFTFQVTQEIVKKGTLVLKGKHGVEELEIGLSLSEEMGPFQAGKYDVGIIMQAPPTKENGKRWDNPMLGAAPDLWLNLGIGVRIMEHPTIYRNTHRGSWIFRSIMIEEGENARITLLDKDLYFHDKIATCRFTFRDLCLDKEGIADNLTQCGRAQIRIRLKKAR